MWLSSTTTCAVVTLVYSNFRSTFHSSQPPIWILLQDILCCGHWYTHPWVCLPNWFFLYKKINHWSTNQWLQKVCLPQASQYCSHGGFQCLLWHSIIELDTFMLPNYMLVRFNHTLQL
jgi:hypothetical protein